MTGNKIEATDIRYFLVATILLCVCQLLVVFVPFRWYISLFQGHKVGSDTTIKPEKILVVRKALLRGLHYLPWKAKCLVQALTGKALLKLLRQPGTIYLGVSKDDQGLKAHAWLKSGDQFISGKSGYKRYTVVREFS